MVALAILSALATLAIPRLLAFRARALRSEAQTHLAFIAKAEQIYFGDQRVFTDDLGRLNLALSGSPRYLYGFTTDATPSQSARNDTAELLASGGGGTFSPTQMVDAFGVLLTEVALPPAPVTPTTFCVAAVGNADADPVLDQWTVSQDGIVVNVVSDLEDGL